MVASVLPSVIASGVLVLVAAVLIAAFRLWVRSYRRRHPELLDRDPNRDRSYMGFLRAIHDMPGQSVNVTAALGGFAILAYHSGILDALETVGVVLLIMMTAGYLAWRRWGY